MGLVRLSLCESLLAQYQEMDEKINSVRAYASKHRGECDKLMTERSSWPKLWKERVSLPSRFLVP